MIRTEGPRRGRGGSDAVVERSFVGRLRLGTWISRVPPVGLVAMEGDLSIREAAAVPCSPVVT